MYLTGSEFSKKLGLKVENIGIGSFFYFKIAGADLNCYRLRNTQFRYGTFTHNLSFDLCNNYAVSVSVYCQLYSTSCIKLDVIYDSNYFRLEPFVIRTGSGRI